MKRNVQDEKFFDCSSCPIEKTKNKKNKKKKGDIVIFTSDQFN